MEFVTDPDLEMDLLVRLVLWCLNGIVVRDSARDRVLIHKALPPKNLYYCINSVTAQ